MISPTPSPPASHAPDLVQRGRGELPARPGLSSALARILIGIEALVPCDRALIWLLDEDSRTLTTVCGRERGEDWNPRWVRPATWPAFTPALRDNVFLMAPRAEMPGLENAAHGETYARHFLVGPIRDADRAFGVLSLTRTDDRPFSDGDLQTLRTIAGLASIAVRSALAIEAEREQRHLVMQTGILTASLNQARTPEAVVRALLRGVARLVGVEHSYVALMSPTPERQVNLYLAEPLRTDGRAVVPGLDPAELAVETTLQRTRRHVSGPRFRALLEQPPIARPDGMHGLAAVPIRNGTRLDGVLYLWSPLPPDDPAFTELSAAAIDIAETLCAQAAVALERTWLQQHAQRTAHEQRTLAAFSARLASALTREEMAEAALDALATMIPMRAGRVWTIDAPEADAEGIASWPGAGAIDDDTARALRMLEAWVQADTAGWNGPLATWVGDADPEGHVVCWPVASDDSPIGTLTILRAGGDPLAPHELDLVSHTCGQLALGLQRARSHAEALVARDEAERYAGIIARMLSISNEMSRQDGLDEVLAVMDRGISALVDFTVLEIYLADEEQERLDLIHYRAIDDRQPSARRMPYGSGVVGRAARLRRPAQGARVGPAGRTRVLGVPMVIEGRLLGVITLGRDDNASFTDQELSLLGIFSAHAASELSRADLNRRNRELYLGGIRALTSTVDAKDPHNRGHSARVGRLSRQIAEAMRLPREDVERVELAGLLHDVGKIGIPDSILQKPGPLDQQERAIMMGHAELGARILFDASSEALESLVPLVLHHHEWWNGRGYPGALRGTDIPLGAQIIGVADAFDTMTHDRPYRAGASVPEAWQVLHKASGTQFSPAVIAAMADVVAGLPAEPSPIGPWGDTAPRVDAHADMTGQLGDLRSLGILVGLARITSHMTDLPSLVEQMLGMIAARLDLSLVLVLHPGERERASLEAFCHTPNGYRILPCPSSDCLDTLVAAGLPAALDAIEGLADLPLVGEIFRSARNTGVVALETRDELTGALLFEPREPERRWRADLEVIEAIAPHVSAAVNVARMHEQAKEDALTDGLTGALNYRAFQRELTGHILFDGPFAVMMLDVVGLKPLNDTAGHLAGDQLLRHAVEVIRESLPDGAIVARIGGDEFGVLLTGAEATQMQRIGQRIVKRMDRDVAAAHRHTVTLRFGWAAYPLDGRTPDLLLHVADQRMYLNHPTGRLHSP